MREKSDAVDYHYFCDPNIICLNLDHNFIHNAINEIIKLPVEIKKELIDMQLDLAIVNQLLDDVKLYYCFNTINNQIHDPQMTTT